MKKTLASAFAAGVAVAIVLGATTDDSVEDRKYLEYAKGFASYTAKVKVPCGEKTCEATATLIADHWAITAAHVVDGATTATLFVGGEPWKVDRIIRHPDFNREPFGKNDLALLHSERSFDLEFYPPLSDGSEKPGDIVSIAGYGVSGGMGSGYDRSDGRLRAGTNHIDRMEGAIIVCTASPGRSKYEICIAPGDSGGPLFCAGKLCGVNSITMAAKGPLRSKAGEESGHVRVSLYRKWIEEAIK